MKNRLLIPSVIFISLAFFGWSFVAGEQQKYSVEVYLSYPKTWGEGKTRLEKRDTVTQLQRLNVYYTKDLFYIPEFLPPRLRDTTRASDTLHIVGGRDFANRKEITMIYDKNGFISKYANYGCMNCTFEPYEYSFTFDKDERPVTITNRIGKMETYEMQYAEEGYMKLLEKKEKGEVTARIEIKVSPLK